MAHLPAGSPDPRNPREPRRQRSARRPVPEVEALYQRANRLEPYGFDGWIGREPHGASPADLGYYRDDLFADQVCALFDVLESDRSSSPWLTVASFVNPHDIFAAGAPWQFWGLEGPDPSVPEPPAAPSQEDSFESRPACHAAYRDVLPKMMLPQELDVEYRRLYYGLHQRVDRSISRVLERLEASRFAEETIVVFTSDHGDLLGSHGGLSQKWYCAYDEVTRVPLVVAGPDIAPRPDGIQVPTSHVDLLPTLLGLAGIDREAARRALTETHTEVHPLCGRDLSGLLLGGATEDGVEEPIYFMTEDQISRGFQQRNKLTAEPYAAVPEPANIESVITRRAGEDGALGLWKLNHYYDRLPARSRTDPGARWSRVGSSTT